MAKTEGDLKLQFWSLRKNGGDPLPYPHPSLPLLLTLTPAVSSDLVFA